MSRTRISESPAFRQVQSIISKLGKQANGSKISMRGQPDLLQQALSSLQQGLLVALVVIFLLMAIFFQSYRIALVVLSVLPGRYWGLSTYALFFWTTL